TYAATNAFAAFGEVPSASAGSVGTVALGLADGDPEADGWSEGRGAGSGAASEEQAAASSSTVATTA
ncbi:MAG: hypothetical protein WBQ50_10755, partial [Nocardioides sp.]